MASLDLLEAEIDEIKKQLSYLTKASNSGTSTGGETGESQPSQNDDWITLYDCSSEDANINLGYASGIKGGTGTIEIFPDLMTYKYFKSTTTIKLLNAFQYGTLVLACDKYLMQHNYPILAKILVSDCYVRFDRTNVIGNKIKDKIENSKKYKELFARKYKDYEGDIESALLKLLNLIAGSNFIDKNNEEIFQDELKGPEIANEIIELAYHF